MILIIIETAYRHRQTAKHQIISQEIYPNKIVLTKVSFNNRAQAIYTPDGEGISFDKEKRQGFVPKGTDPNPYKMWF
jgi:hypothetical protein